MGLWTWLTEVLCDRTGNDPKQTVGGAGRERQADSGGVATLEAPPGMGGRGNETPSDYEEIWWAADGATLLELTPPDRPGLSTEVRALENLLISHFDGHDLNMPPLLHVAERVLSLLRSKKTHLSTVAKEISTDQVIAASVLRMANSPLYRGLNKITSLQPAVTRLGSRALQTLMMHESLRGAMFHGKGTYRKFAEVLWARSLACAYIMRGLSRFTQVDEEDAFLIGLLHDIGNVIVLRVVQSQSGSTAANLDMPLFDYLCSETHQEFGELVADAWQLPSGVKSLTADHHSYPGEDDPLRTERLQLQLTDMIASCLGYAPVQPYNILDSRPVRDLDLSARGDFVPFLAELPGQIDEVIEGL